MKKVLFIAAMALFLVVTYLVAMDVGTVTRVIDGDTFKVEINGEEQTVRLLGVDTPESVKPGTPVQPGAIEASKYTKQLTGKKVLLIYDEKKTDFFGRVLAYVWVEYPEGEGLICWNLHLIQEGYGSLYTKYKFSKREWFEKVLE